ncbi:MAG: type IIA DNA topoisomerase subunit B [Muribaculaceae bacterium]|nr:type IIA DNA topoisomerase subunit B [Muribaculaceae bacterium]
MADDNNLLDFEAQPEVNYTEKDIKSLDPRSHVRIRPTMYIGKTGDGSGASDGIYVLLKEVLDNSIDEYMMGYGKQITVDVTETTATIRDNGRGIPFGSLLDAVSRMNTSGKFDDSKAFQKSVGLNGVGIKATNYLSKDFIVESVRDGLKKRLVFAEGILVTEEDPFECDEPTGTMIQFTPDNTIFKGYRFLEEYVVPLIRNYTFLNVGLAIYLNGKRYISRNGLLDLLKENMTSEPLYPPIHLKGQDIEIAFTHSNQYGEEYYSFVNSQHTTQGGTHLSAFKESVARTINEYFGNKKYEYADIRNGLCGAISVRIQNPEFESQTKIKLTSSDMGPGEPKVTTFINNFIKKELDNYLHKNLDVADIILKKVQDNERQRKAMAGASKQARERAKKVNLNNRKLLDCRVHLNDTRGDEEKKMASSIFITEGDSASGSITKIRDVDTQAVFSLRGKPLNSYGLTQKIVYENEEFNLLQAALNIEEGIDGLRYNNVIIATDADVDGMHIRLLMLTFFLQFFPDLVKKGHVYVLQTPLFRVRNKETVKRGRGKDKAKEETYYCYTDQERLDAIAKLGSKAEITRFKGLGEISPEEFRDFIGPDMRLEPVSLRKNDAVAQLLSFYMGKNTSERQNFIIDNLVIEDDSEML